MGLKLENDVHSLEVRVRKLEKKIKDLESHQSKAEKFFKELQHAMKRFRNLVPDIKF